MFRHSLRHLQGENYLKLKTTLILLQIISYILYGFSANDKFLPEDDAINAETFTTVLIIIHVFYCMRVFRCYIKDLITIVFIDVGETVSCTKKCKIPRKTLKS